MHACTRTARVLCVGFQEAECFRERELHMKRLFGGRETSTPGSKRRPARGSTVGGLKRQTEVMCVEIILRVWTLF